MNRFDRYMLSQLMVLFGFFALVLVMVYWVNRAVVLFDRLIADGHSVGVFFEFTALSLPTVIQLILPIAAFAGGTYVTNRLMNESELTVMQATGFSPWRLANPVLHFGLIVAAMMAALSLYLVPQSLHQLEIREREISENATARLLTEGVFLHPDTQITFYIADISPQGVLENVFLSDFSDPTQSLTYTADEAYLIKDESGPKLILVDGMAQVFLPEENRLFTTTFGDFTYDISELLQYQSNQTKALDRTSTRELWQNPVGLAQDVGLDVGWVIAERHERIASVGMGLLAGLVGFATLLIGRFSRMGAWPQIIIAFVILVVLDGMKTTVIAPVRANPGLWPLIYMPFFLGLAIVSGMLAYKAMPIRRSRRAAL